MHVSCVGSLFSGQKLVCVIFFFVCQEKVASMSLQHTGSNCSAILFFLNPKLFYNSNTLCFLTGMYL